MSFCKSAMKAIKKVWDEVTPELGEIIATITKVTGAIKALGESPEVNAILQLLNVSTPEVRNWITNAVDEIADMTNVAATLEEKIGKWLDTATSEADRNSKLLKIAQVAVKYADPEPSSTKGESFYDSAVQLRIIADKHA